VIATAFLAAACACTEADPPSVYVEADYQVRCLDCEPRAADEPAHDVRAVEGQRDFQVFCTRDRVAGVSVVSFGADSDRVQVNGNQGFGFEVRTMVPGADPGSSCQVLLHEGVNRYEGRCSAAEPDPEIPCQVTSSAEGGTLRGSLLCANLPNASSAQLRRAVVRSLTREPAEFEVHGCPSQ
jgi:hypothetical protein